MNKKIIITAVVLYFGIAAYGHFYTPYDDTDNEAYNLRSGMKLYTDYGTGCQYLSTPFSNNLIPRMDSNHNHVCLK